MMPSSWRRPARILAALAFAFLLSGCARPINRHAERLIREQLNGYIGPAGAWTVRVDGAPLNTLRGDLSRVAIRGSGVALRDAIELAELEVTLTRLKIDIGRRKVRSVGAAGFRATIAEAAINRYLKQDAGGDANYRVRVLRLQQGKLILYGQRRMLGRWWDFTVRAEPRLVSPTRLAYDPDRMTVVGVRLPIPRSVLRRYARRLASGFDFSVLPFPVRITSVAVDQAAVSITGDVEVTDGLRDQLDEMARLAAPKDTTAPPP
jgi:hypothetical protein